MQVFAEQRPEEHSPSAAHDWLSTLRHVCDLELFPVQSVPDGQKLLLTLLHLPFRVILHLLFWQRALFEQSLSLEQ